MNLLESGGFRGKKDTSSALYSLCSVKENKIRVVQAGIMKSLVEEVFGECGNCLFLGKVEEIGGGFRFFIIIFFEVIKIIL